MTYREINGSRLEKWRGGGVEVGSPPTPISFSDVGKPVDWIAVSYLQTMNPFLKCIKQFGII